MLHTVIMAGGSGTRFWPQSRRSMPKQLLRLAGEQTMIQSTVSRCQPWVAPEQTWIVTNRMQADETRRQLPDVPQSNVLIEPCGRNTAPCIGLAAVHVLQQDPDAVMFVMPADHVIQPVEAFQAAAQNAAALVESQPDRFVLFGVPPTYAATGYGYIERGAALDGDVPGAFQVQSFREKPARDVAEQYVAAGTYYWNCGIFCWRAQAILDALESYEPNIHQRLMTIAASAGGADEERTLAEQFPGMDSISIDYAVLERAQNVSVIEATFEWDDVGSWLSLPRLLGFDENGNTIDGRWCGTNSKGCIVRTNDDHLIATVGLENVIVVHTPDATLIASRDEAESIRDLLGELEQRGFENHL